mgnify:CR=1 FL=1|tara:strand:- start:189 stop:860 length:672 start_codon:yes stop_codon:yes gene_type:complete
MATKKNKCTYCKERLLVESMVKTPAGKFCTFDHAIKYANDKQAKQREVNLKKAVKCEQVKDKAFNRETMRRKEAIKKRTGSKGFYSDLATALHYYVKHILRKGEPCYTCGLEQRFEDSGQKFHVGHFIPQKSVDPRRFMLMNLRMQCYKCNSHNSGMRAEYRQHLIEDKGIEHVEWLECDVNHKSLKEQYPEISDIKAETARYRKLTRDKNKDDSQCPHVERF